MLPLLLFGMLNISISVYFWSKEIKPWLDNLYEPKLTKLEFVNIFKRIYGMLVNIYRFFVYGKYLMIDLLITAGCISMLGFGDAVSGGILGLFLSNCISILVLMTMNKRMITSKALSSANN
jgi:hypothetical protein